MFLKIYINLHAFWFVSYFIYFLFTFYYLFIHAICLVFGGGGELERIEKSKKKLTKTVQTKYDELGIKRLSIIISAV